MLTSCTWDYEDQHQMDRVGIRNMGKDLRLLNWYRTDSRKKGNSQSHCLVDQKAGRLLG